MSEQGEHAPGPEPGAPPPAVAGPEGTPGTVEQAPHEPDVDWQKRYVDIQREYTRSQQENAQLHQLLTSDDPDTRRAAAEALGYEIQEEEPDLDLDDPVAALGERLGRIEQSLSQREQEAENEAYAEQVRVIVDEQLTELGVPEADQDWVLAYAVNALPPNDEGLPDLVRAYGVFKDREDARQRAWAASKRAPHIAPHGQPATEVPNLDNRQERQDYMTRRLMENEQI